MGTMEAVTVTTEENLNGCVFRARNVHKSYVKNEYVLKGLDINVKQGEIYCLLGASGCGKSTFLNIIVGLLDPDSGFIETTLKSREDVGYMTQETSLYDQFTIRETFFYFGVIYGLNRENITSETSRIHNLLNLPELDSWVNELSGGQRRRVSLAIALLHNPKLLVLDEPTVGVDSLLRQSIWDHLVQLCEEDKKTIIITTHYIEEGQQAHRVGFMRNGIMLCEEPPQQLIQRNNVTSLEDVFLCLSKKQDFEIEKKSNNQVLQNCAERQKYPLRLKATTSLNINKISGEMIKNLIYLKRNLSVAAFTLILPAFSMIIFSFTTGREPDSLKLGVVNDEVPLGLSFCNNVTRKENCNMEYLSCIYVDKLRDKNLDIIQYNEVEEGIKGVESNKIWGVLHFPQNYSNTVYTLIDNILTNDQSVFDNRAYVYMDYSNLIIKDLLLRDIRDSYIDMMKKVYHNCSWPIEAAEPPIHFQEPIFGDAVPNFRIFFSSPTMVMLLLTTPLMYGLTIMIEEKRCGATARSIIAGVNIMEVMTAHFIVQVCLQIIQTLMVVIVAFVILGFPFNQPILTTLLLYLQSISGIALAFTVAALTDSLAVSNSFQTMLCLQSMMVGGMMWPIEGIPRNIKFLSWLLPCTFPIEAIRSLTIRGKGINDFVVYRGFLSTFFWTLLFSLFTFIYVKKTRARTFLNS